MARAKKPILQPVSGEPEVEMVQRSYWLRREDVVLLEALKGKIMLSNDLDNVDLSAAIRGLIQYGDKILSEGSKKEREALSKTIIGAKNTKRRGPTGPVGLQ